MDHAYLEHKKTSVARRRRGCDWGRDAVLHPALLHPCSVTLGSHHGLPSEGKQVASNNVKVVSGCFSGVHSVWRGSRPFSYLLLNVQWWCFVLERDDASTRRGIIQEQQWLWHSFRLAECSQPNTTSCVPFKTKKWPSEELSHHCGFPIGARAQGIIRRIFLGGGWPDGGWLGGTGPHLTGVERPAEHGACLRGGNYGVWFWSWLWLMLRCQVTTAQCASVSPVPNWE